MMRHLIGAMMLANAAWAQGGPPSMGTPIRPFHVANYDLAVDLPETGKTIAGNAVLSVERLGPGDTLRLDLLDLTVTSVTLDGRTVGFVHDAGQLRIPVAATAARFTVAVRYGGAVTDGLIIGTDSAGRWMAFGDNWPNRARRWIPSIDHPSDKATVSWTVKAPSDRRVIANGSLLEETPLPTPRDPDGSAGRPVSWTITRWRESRPIPAYLMVIAAAPLVRFELGTTACGVAEFPGCVPQQLYVAPEQRHMAPGEFARAGDIVGFFGRLVGPFPYEKLSHLQSTTRFGGMENASAIFYDDKIFRRKGADAGLIAHETAHQWFGDAVTEREWGHLWLSEGFATYFSALYLGHAFGDTALVGHLRRDRDGLVKSANVATRPVIDSTQTNLMALLNDNSYQKGGWVLHMLRQEVGDSAFFGGIRDYWAAHKHATAVSDDLRAAVEKRAGRDLRWFFDQWLRRPGVADVTTSWRYDAAKHELHVVVEQGSRVAPYRLKLPVQVTDAAGATRTQVLEIGAQVRSERVIPLATAPSAVVVDPGVTVLGAFSAK